MSKKRIPGVDYSTYSPNDATKAQLESKTTIEVPSEDSSIVISFRVSPALFEEVEKLSEQSGADRSAVLKQLIAQGLLEVRKQFLGKSRLELKAGANPESAIFPDKGKLLEERYMRSLLFSDVNLATGKLRSLRSKWDLQ